MVTLRKKNGRVPLTLATKIKGHAPYELSSLSSFGIIDLILPPPSLPPPLHHRSPPAPFFLSFFLSFFHEQHSSNGSAGTHARNGFVFLSCISPFYFAIKHFHIAFTWSMKVPFASQVGSRPLYRVAKKKRTQTINL